VRRLTFWEAVFLIVGTQIGAGILGLPKVVAPLGTFWGSAAIVLAGLLSMLTAIFLLEALYKVNPRYHIYDLSAHFFGKWGIILTLAILYSGYGALVAYVGGVAQIIHTMLGISPQIAGFVFWLLASVVVIAGLKITGAAEETLDIIMFILIATAVVWALPHASTYTRPFNISLFSVAFSVAVFAFFAHVVLPEITREFRNRYEAAAIVTTAFTITTIVYLLFALTIAGVTKDQTTDIGTEGLISVLGGYFGIVAYLLPLLTITTSFIGIGLAQSHILREMVKNKGLSYALALLPPLLLFALGLRAFVQTIFFSSLGLLLAGGVLPPIMFILSRRHGKPLYAIDTRLAYFVLGFFVFILVYSALNAFL